VAVPTQVTAATIVEGEVLPRAATCSAEVDSSCCAGVSETQSADTTRAYSTEVGGTKSTHAAHVSAAESAGVASAKPAASVASAAPTAATRLCRGCNRACGEGAGDENDHRLLQHLPISFFLAAACTEPIAIGTRWCALAPAGFLPLRRLARGCRDLKAGRRAPDRQVSRFRSSPEFAARSGANFGIEGHQQLYDSSAALNPKFANGLAAIVCELRVRGTRSTQDHISRGKAGETYSGTGASLEKRQRSGQMRPEKILGKLGLTAIRSDDLLATRRTLLLTSLMADLPLAAPGTAAAVDLTLVDPSKPGWRQV